MGYKLDSSLPDYVKRNENELLYKSVFGSASVERFSKQYGVKGKAAINLLSTDVTFGDGASCGFEPEGDTTFSQREIDTRLIKVDKEYCYKSLIGKYPEYEVKISANQEAMPFEEEITTMIADAIKANMELVVWQGDTASEDKKLKRMDGLVKILDRDVPEANKVALSGTSAWDHIKAVWKAIPRAARRKAGLKINVSPEEFDQFILDLIEKNLYHYAGPQNAAPMEFVLPGTNIPVVSVDGLAGTKKVIAAVDSNIYYGTDYMGNEEEFSLWYSKDNDTFRLKVLWNAGVQVAFPDEVVVGTIA